uniref:Uncharacterized protein n=1 Tax=Arundo donax TaxID=35708 RepID=A0A0A9A5Q1_ARUDO
MLIRTDLHKNFFMFNMRYSKFISQFSKKLDL